jgi:hypothetical protein
MIGEGMRLLVLTVAIVLIAGSSGAQQTDGGGQPKALPQVKTLPGGAPEGGRWTPPRIDNSHTSSMPDSEFMANDKAEGYVLVRFTIAADGHVKNPVVESVIGPESYARRATESALSWTYIPATLDGKPVETDYKVAVVYSYHDVRGARPKVYSLYNSARSLTAEGKYAEAVAKLDQILSMDRLTFYERTMAAFAKSLNNVGLKNYDAARMDIRAAMVPGYEYLDVRVRPEALVWRIRLEAMGGHYADALAWYETLKSLLTKKHAEETMPQDMPVLVGKIQALLANPKPIFVAARIPQVQGFLPSWTHKLVRPTFSFLNLKGNVSVLYLYCSNHHIRSPIAEKAEWHVPKTWEGCDLTVFGDPDASFVLAEMAD